MIASGKRSNVISFLEKAKPSNSFIVLEQPPDFVQMYVDFSSDAHKAAAMAVAVTSGVRLDEESNPWSKYAIAGAAAVFALLFALNCHTPPTITTTDTKGQQTEAKLAAELLAVRPVPPGALDRAERVLNSCADTLARKDAEVQACAVALADVGQRYNKLESDFREYRSENGFFSRLGLRATWFGIGAASAIALAVLLYFSGSLAQIVARSAHD